MSQRPRRATANYGAGRKSFREISSDEDLSSEDDSDSSEEEAPRLSQSRKRPAVSKRKSPLPTTKKTADDMNGFDEYLKRLRTRNEARAQDLDTERFNAELKAWNEQERKKRVKKERQDKYEASFLRDLQYVSVFKEVPHQRSFFDQFHTSAATSARQSQLAAALGDPNSKRFLDSILPKVRRSDSPSDRVVAFKTMFETFRCMYCEAANVEAAPYSFIMNAMSKSVNPHPPTENAFYLSLELAKIGIQGLGFDTTLMDVVASACPTTPVATECHRSTRRSLEDLDRFDEYFGNTPRHNCLDLQRSASHFFVLSATLLRVERHTMTPAELVQFLGFSLILAVSAKLPSNIHMKNLFAALIDALVPRLRLVPTGMNEVVVNACKCCSERPLHSVVTSCFDHCFLY